jgi:DNA-directed RNA polymerase specialized sigma24 family protein
VDPGPPKIHGITEPILQLLGKHPSVWRPVEREAFTQWVSASPGYRDNLKRYAKRWLEGRGDDDAEDAVQEVLSELSRPDWPASVKRDALEYVHSGVRTACTRRNRQRRREPSWSECLMDDDDDPAAPEAEGPEAQVLPELARPAEQQRREMLLSRLTADMREAITAVLDGLASTGRLPTSEDVAGRLRNVSAGAVRKRLERARKILRAGWFEEP